jgi:hypothetical protein
VMLVTVPIFGDNAALALGRWTIKETTIKFYFSNLHYWMLLGAAVAIAPHITAYIARHRQYA